ncbi:hypothetical protein COLO4_30949 [Corchorus olitorius]|uniref:Uncharacterized protein n=1 Tax=Corchorus olitorius TaxID=93759 RepID=A0A1R3H6A6_9ROSI|nr:hypothetical protein COLO4_30949 [Corchorus olitorius]
MRGTSKSNKQEEHDKYQEPLFQRVIASVIGVIVTHSLHIFWHNNITGHDDRDQYISWLAFALGIEDKLEREVKVEKIGRVLGVLCICSYLFLIKGVIRPSDGRKQKELNLILNAVLSIITILSVSVVTGAMPLRIYISVMVGSVLGLLSRVTYFICKKQKQR